MKINSKVMIVVSIWMYRYVQCIASALIACIVFQFGCARSTKSIYLGLIVACLDVAVYNSGVSSV